MLHWQRDAVEAHLTIVFTALAIARFLQDEAGFSILRTVSTLHPLQDVTISLAGQAITAAPEHTADAGTITHALKAT